MRNNADGSAWIKPENPPEEMDVIDVPVEVLDRSGFPAKQAEPLRLWVAVQGAGVYLVLSKTTEQVAFTPFEALMLARELKAKANQVLHEEHVAAMQSKRRAKQAHKAAVHARK